jgi:cell division protein ZapE
VRHIDGVAWFDFETLCGGPRGPSDYVEIALCYPTVLLSRIPKLADADDDKAKRFVTLVDALYDRSVKLIVSAAAPPEELYAGRGLAKVFQRTISRLKEMATVEYLAREHLP